MMFASFQIHTRRKVSLALRILCLFLHTAACLPTTKERGAGWLRRCVDQPGFRGGSFRLWPSTPTLPTRQQRAIRLPEWAQVRRDPVACAGLVPRPTPRTALGKSDKAEAACGRKNNTNNNNMGGQAFLALVHARHTCVS